MIRILLCFGINALLVCSLFADESNTQKLKKFFSGDRYLFTCLDFAFEDPEISATTLKFASWTQENGKLFKRLLAENDGRPIPYHETMQSSGIAREQYAKMGTNSLQAKEVGDALEYIVSKENGIARFELKRDKGSTKSLSPNSIPYGVNRILTLTQVDLGTTVLRLMDFDAGEAKWITGESKMLGQYRGFEWRHDDERLLDLGSIPAGEVAVYIRVQKLYSTKARKIYCNYKFAKFDRDGIHVNTDFTFWLVIDPTK